MTVRTTVHLLRHGEVFNPEGVLYGRLPDFHLSDLGVAMAERVAEWLVAHDRDVTHLVSSPLERAQETAAPTAAAYDLPVVTDPRVIEAGNLFEGREFGVGNGALRHPGVWWWLRNPFRPTWGEPYAEIAERMRLAAEDARDAARGHEAVVVSHQLPVWTARQAFEGRRFAHDPRRRQCALASLTSITYLDDAVFSVGYTEPAADLVPAVVEENFTAGA